MANDLRLIWTDLEMTGLDEARDVIIEIGIIITGADLVPIAEFERVIWQPDSALAAMEPFVREMHTKSGLLERVRAGKHALRDVEKEVVALLAGNGVGPGEGVLAGNSIHADRRFLARYMPSFERYLHYRQVDVSSLKVLAQAWYPAVPKFDKPDKTHTALDDIRGSLAELAYYRVNLLR